MHDAGGLRHGESSYQGAGENQMPTDVTEADQRDYQVLEVVLEDLLAYKGKDSPHPFRDPSADHILFDRTTVRYQIGRSEILEAFRRERGIHMTADEQEVVGHLADDMLRRNKHRVSFTGFKPRDKQIIILEQNETSPPAKRGLPLYFPERPVGAWLPGYSADGSFALRSLSILWSIHYAKGTYLLAKRGSVWRVQRRSFTYYP
jgi:hypothetical protein